MDYFSVLSIFFKPIHFGKMSTSKTGKYLEPKFVAKMY